MTLKDIFSVCNLYTDTKKIKLIKLFGRRFFSDNAICKEMQPKPITKGLTGFCDKQLDDYISIVAIPKNEAPYIK